MYCSALTAILYLTSAALGSDTEGSCKSSNAKTMLDSAVNLIKDARDKCSDERRCPERPVDCEEVLNSGQTESGVYEIWPRNRIMSDESMKVYCDMATAGGGWTVIQRRGNFGKSKEFFYKDWEAYELGFGDISQDFWLGNKKIYSVSNQRLYSIRFDLRKEDGEARYAAYDTFWIDSGDFNYTLHVNGYSGTAGDSFTGHSNNQFSTYDRDNDKHESNCARTYKGGWWYAACHVSNLNGLYLDGEHKSFADGVEWKSWTGYNYSLTYTEMKIRPLFTGVKLTFPPPSK